MTKTHASENRVKVAAILFLSVALAITAFFGLSAIKEPTARAAHVAVDSWASYHGSTDVEFLDGAMKMTSDTNPGSVFFTERKFENYEAEAELKLVSGSWFGIMYRTDNNQKGFYQLGTGANGYHQLKRHLSKASGSGWDEVNIVKANEGYSPYTLGTHVNIKWKVVDNTITLYTKPEGQSEYFAEFTDVPLPKELSGGAGYVGFCMQYSEVVVYGVTIKDLDGDYVYASDFDKRSQKKAEWSVIRGAVTPTYADGVYSLAFTANPTVYGIGNVEFKNYEAEMEYSFTGNWAGIAIRTNGIHKALAYVDKRTANAKALIAYHQTKSGDGWGTAAAGTGSLSFNDDGFTRYTAGTRVRMKVTVQDNLADVCFKYVGVDEDYSTLFENIDLSTIFGGLLGYRGGVGICSPSSSTVSVYDFFVKDTDAGKTYYLPNTLNENGGTWAVTRGTATPENVEENGENILKIAPSANPTSYVLTGANWRNYVLETEFSFNANWAGVVIRANSTYKGIYGVNTTTQYFNQHQTASGDTWASNVIADRSVSSTYTLNDRIKLRITVNDGLITTQSMIVGKDDGWKTMFESFKMYDICAKNGTKGVLGEQGEVGFVTRTGTTMKVYAFNVTDTDTGYTYDYFAEEEAKETDVIDNYVNFDGNHVVETQNAMTQMPDTTEVWFRTSAKKRQTIINDFRYWQGLENGFTLDVLENGTLEYYETNGGENIPFDVFYYDSSTVYNTDFYLDVAGNFSDGQWHKAVIRRYYDEEKGLLTVELTVLTDNKIVASNSQTREIAPSKKALYEKNDGVFIVENRLQIGTYIQVRQNFEGDISEIRMWDHARSDEEIAQAIQSPIEEEGGLIYRLVPAGSTFAETVTSGSENELVMEEYEVWMNECVFGEADYRIAVLPDLQFINEGFEVTLRKYFIWIRENAEKLNIKLVISVGDLVNTCTPEQMFIISEAASLLDGVVPFMPVMGNHDYPTNGRDSMLFNEYFPYEKYAKYDYFGGAYEEGKMDNYYYLLNLGGVDYMFMAFEVAVRPEVAEWANGVVSENPDRKVVVISHVFMDSMFGDILSPTDCGGATSYKNDDGMEANEFWDTFVSKHDNIVMYICGHMNNQRALHRSFETASGHFVQSLEFDFSQIERHYGAPGIIGMLGFNYGSNKVSVNTYATQRGQFLMDVNQYEIEFDYKTEYRVAFESAQGAVCDRVLTAGAEITAPASPENYSDGELIYTFVGWEGYTEGMTADKNYTFTAIYEKSAASSVTAYGEQTIAENVQSAKEALFGGNENAYIAIAENVAAVNTVTTGESVYSSQDTLDVFGKTVRAFYAEGGKLYVHILALGSANCVIVGGEIKTYILVSAFEKGVAEVTTPKDLNRSRYDYITEKNYVAVYEDDEIAFTANETETGENAVVLSDGKYLLIKVTSALSRNVASIGVAAMNFEGDYAIFEQNTVSYARVKITLVEKTNIDGDLSDWSEDILATGKTLVGIDDTSDKRVTYYAYLGRDGLYFAADAYHELLVNNSWTWFENTNLEVCINGKNADGELNYQVWVTAFSERTHELVNGVIKTEKTENGYHSIAEGFIAMKDLPLNALTGELSIGFGWKTPGDNIKYYNIASGYDWWFPSRRSAHEIRELYFVNASGLWLYSSVRTVNNIILDGDFSDFNEQALSHGISVESADGTLGYDVVAQYVQGSGIYVGLVATHRTNPHPKDNYSWYNNTNFEFYIGGNRYYITAPGAAAGNGLYGRNVYLDQSFDEETGLWTTTIEFFIPDSAMGSVTYADYVRMGFAFRPTGENVLLEGYSEPTDYWCKYGYSPKDTETQFYVYDSGFSLTEAVRNVPETCTDLLLTTFTDVMTGETFVVESIPENRDELHSWKTVVTKEASCTEDGEGHYECERCKKTEAFTIKALGHDLVHHDGKEPTCTEGGFKPYETCTRCDYTTYEEIEPLGHEYGDWIAEVPATANVGGVKGHYHCEVCGKDFDEAHDEIDDLSIPATGEEQSGGDDTSSSQKDSASPSSEATSSSDKRKVGCSSSMNARVIAALTIVALAAAIVTARRKRGLSE